MGTPVCVLVYVYAVAQPSQVEVTRCVAPPKRACKGRSRQSIVHHRVLFSQSPHSSSQPSQRTLTSQVHQSSQMLSYKIEVVEITIIITAEYFFPPEWVSW